MVDISKSDQHSTANHKVHSRNPDSDFLNPDNNDFDALASSLRRIFREQRMADIEDLYMLEIDNRKMIFSSHLQGIKTSPPGPIRLMTLYFVLSGQFRNVSATRRRKIILFM